MSDFLRRAHTSSSVAAFEQGARNARRESLEKSPPSPPTQKSTRSTRPAHAPHTFTTWTLPIALFTPPLSRLLLPHRHLADCSSLFLPPYSHIATPSQVFESPSFDGSSYVDDLFHTERGRPLLREFEPPSPGIEDWRQP